MAVSPELLLDLMGGDHAPHAAIEGCMLALEKHTPVIALGTAEAVELLISKVQDPNLTSVVCNQVITNEESPVRAQRPSLILHYSKRANHGQK